jgi:hypothetical protein
MTLLVVIPNLAVFTSLVPKDFAKQNAQSFPERFFHVDQYKGERRSLLRYCRLLYPSTSPDERVSFPVTNVGFVLRLQYLAQNGAACH